MRLLQRVEAIPEKLLAVLNSSRTGHGRMSIVHRRYVEPHPDTRNQVTEDTLATDSRTECSKAAEVQVMC